LLRLLVFAIVSAAPPGISAITDASLTINYVNRLFKTFGWAIGPQQTS